MDFYYQTEIASLIPTCPPLHYKQISVKSFRWVFDTIEDPRNFQAQAEKNPKVLNDKSDEQKCAYYALSFFGSQEQCKRAFNMYANWKNAYKRLGTKIAEGLLEEADGVGENRTSGHFNFHHIRNHNFQAKFVIIGNLL